MSLSSESIVTPDEAVDWNAAADDSVAAERTAASSDDEEAGAR
jgi:hypothetical protein